MEIERMKEAFDFHRDQNDVSIDQYVLHSQIELGQSLEGKSAIYLDTKYWIILCEAALGRAKSKVDIELLDCLGHLVTQGSIFCPISETSFIELLKQEDLRTRTKTAELIDQLSLGITLIPFDLRVGIELAHLFQSSIEPNSIYPLNWLVWSKLGYVLGFAHPPNTVLLIQKACFDYIWSISLVEIVNCLDNIPKLSNFNTLASKLNHENAKHASDLRNYENAYLNELSGAIDIFSGCAVDIFHKMEEKSIGVKYEYKKYERAEVEGKLKNLLREAYCKGKINQQAPTLDIHTSCYAAVRWNKGHQLEANSFLDFHHASAALGYCQAFFTERTLCSLLTSKHTSLDKKHDCTVIYKVEDAISYLKSLKG